MTNVKYIHWQEDHPAEGVLQLILNTQGGSVNTLGLAVLKELERLVDQIEKAPPRALIISSAKHAGFLAGADVKEFLDLQSKDEVFEQLQWVQGLFLRIERLPCISIAAVHGHCLGGGLELALACHYRVVAQDAELGLPEVRLGIHPGYGGAIRLPRLIDPVKALNLILAGKTVDGKTAARLGLADAATQQRHLMTAALAIAENNQKPRRKTSLNARLMAFRFARSTVAKMARRQVERRANQKHYPAPYRMIDLWLDAPAGDEEAYRAEAESVAGIFDQPQGMATVRNLVRLFLLDREIRGRARQSPFIGGHVHVVGAGVMGGDIAAWCALRGFDVTLQDAKAEFIGPAIGRASALFKRKLNASYQVTAAMDRLVADPKGTGVAKADLVIEAISEKLEAKQGLFAELEPRMKSDALLATNTSSIPLEKLSENLAMPERLVGIHFFNPVALMQLVEVVQGKNSGKEKIEQATGFVNRIGKLPILVGSSPGFLVNRVLMAYLAESLRMLEEKIAAPLIDRVALDLGFPMGPIELADTVGLDICQAVAGELNAHFGGEPSELVNSKVEKGHLGKKTGQGFYHWSKGKAVKPKYHSGSVDAQLLSDRLLYIMLNESVQCLAESVVQDADTLDVGMVFGTGYPPFRGGPINTIREIGVDQCKQRLAQLTEQVGDRFAPKPGWQTLQIDSSDHQKSAPEADNS